ncbi:hypothetical protein BU23DRAFT_560747 [Bimuria novae-zelandiae CBS 107.79]|uniref:Uncharacterized protein n=1 Tax=Bimuria novae-zelandiae CBS 107.79 TaxID=1447943 RepID=A0A6A5ULS8_9PLEO|nr:hypothetical protein BU23DRAFT_560747 [Bimuria novae-zelandiae CBS 107.79]
MPPEAAAVASAFAGEGFDPELEATTGGALVSCLPFSLAFSFWIVLNTKLTRAFSRRSSA